MTEADLNTKAAQTDAPRAEQGTAEHKRILLVEGDGFTRLVLLLRLRLAGFGVDFTSNGILGLGKLRSCQPDILLVELKLGGMSGLELMKAARSEPTFGKRPIFVFTHASKMSRATRKEVGSLATEVFDKASITREDLVQIFASKFSNKEAEAKGAEAGAGGKPAGTQLNEAVLSGAIEQLIAGVREQFELFAKDPEPRVSSGGELLSRLSSLASCAKAARVFDLARQAAALEKFLSQLSRSEQGYTDAAMATLGRGVEVMSGISLVSSNEPGPTRYNVVFIDEAPYSNQAMEEALLNAELDTACFEDPSRAREYLASNRTDLVLANVVLPEGHGLSAADIQRLPFQARTPVLFGPESQLSVPTKDELPVSAPRLDKAPVMLAEMVLRVLNEVQGKSVPRDAADPARKPLENAGNAAALQALPAEDGFDLFAVAPSRSNATPGLPPSQSAQIQAGAVNRPKAFNHLFAAAGIPMEPILRADPNGDSQRENQARMEALTPESTQIDEPVIEAFAPANSNVETPQTIQPETLTEDQAAAAEWIAPEAVDDGQTVAPTNVAPDLDQSQPAVMPVTGEPTENEGPVMNDTVRIAPEDYIPQRDGIQQTDLPAQVAGGREDLAARVCAAEMSLYHAQAQLEQKNKELETLQAQLAAAGNGHLAAEPGSAEQKAQARCAELEQEVSALRQAFEGMNGPLPDPQAASGETARKLEELQRNSEAAAAALKQAETALQESVQKNSQLERELSEARKAVEELSAKSGKQANSNGQPGEQSNGASGSPADLEEQVRQGIAMLARATAELAHERGERQRSQQLAADLNNRLQALHLDLNRTLQAQGDHLSRILALEQQQRQAKEALERSMADLEQQQAERGALETQLQKAREANAQLRNDLSFFDAANRKFDGSRQELHSKLEATLNAARDHETRLQQEKDERQKLAQNLDDVRRELQDQNRKRELLEQQLRAAEEALKEREEQLQKEAAERQRLTEALDSAHHASPATGSERELEFSKLQTALQLEQIERKRQESQLARTRQSALDAALAARSLRTTLRRQIREPVENLAHSAHHLLELEMGEAQKKLAQAVLQDVLLIQTRLREPVSAHGESTEPNPSPNQPTP
ncbi:MAG TPA: hypothetical protein VKY92_02610 [Verrucomicrobiae bacterium]|nr:hypothetical protein [Verrucomicrobiae bacterium]